MPLVSTNAPRLYAFRGQIIHHRLAHLANVITEKHPFPKRSYRLVHITFCFTSLILQYKEVFTGILSNTDKLNLRKDQTISHKTHFDTKRPAD